MSRATAGAAATRSEPRNSAGGRTRSDIQGLRAVAVLIVILDHLTGWPGGGFVGVDMFFVISGFLITSLLVREHERTNSISWVGFYRRRIKRIIPAAVLVIVATLLAARFVFNSARFEPLRADALWALLFSANWRFGLEDIDYFSADRAISPLQHYWSLGIEEQFYFVWPLLMIGIFALLLRSDRSHAQARIVVGTVLALVVAASFIWAVMQTGEDARFAYFSTFTRVWELGVGALLAVAAPLMTRIPDAVRPLTSWLGLAGMVVSLLLIDGESYFPAPAAALPVLATALVIAGGTFADLSRQQEALWPLTNRASTHVGDWSYSLYLWHFPVIVIGTVLIGDSLLDNFLLALSILVLSLLGYELVERPLHHNRWLKPGEGVWRTYVSRSHRRSLPTPTDRWRYTALVGGVIATGLTVLVALQSNAVDQSALERGGIDAARIQEESENLPPQTAALQSQIVEALSATRWPELEPSLDEVIGGAEAPPDVAPCGVFPLVDRASCSWGPDNARRSAIVVGDSAALAYVEPIRTALGKAGYSVSAYATAGCPFTDVLLPTTDSSITDTCEERKADAVSVIKATKPDLVLITNAYQPKVQSNGEVMTNQAWIESTTALVEQFAGSAGKVAFLAAPQTDADVEACYTRQSVPADCVSSVTSEWQLIAASEREIAERVNATWIDSRPLFCSVDLCPAFVGQTPVKLDRNHITQAYGKLIAPALLEQLRLAKVL